VSDELKIEYKWLGRAMGSSVERSFYADIGLAVGEEWLTRLEDLEASTVRTHLRGCAHRLALWFAANWWRLRWEPATRNSRKDAEWLNAHSVAASGGGYIWPNVIFASDGDSLAVAALPRKRGAIFEPIRYLDQIFGRISAVEFEQRVDAFMEGILSRMESRQVEDESLADLWAEVVAERNDRERAERRKLEAMIGYEPDEAPDDVFSRIQKAQNEFGRQAVEEFAAEARRSVGKVLEDVRALAGSKGKPKKGGFRVSLPDFNIPQKFAQNLDRPWQKGAALGRLAREIWGLDDRPVTNKRLAEIVDSDVKQFSHASIAATPIPFGVKKGSNGTFDIYLDSLNVTTRRFTMCRFIGDHLYFATDEKLLPATHVKTSRQKFQRAFAQEFLCPIKVLREKIGTTEPDEDDVAEVANYFEVSPLMIRTTLVNSGDLDREALAWLD
jgi:hypothetical protein